MSNPSLIAALFAAGDASDLEAFDRYLHHDVVVHAPAGLSTVGLTAERESWRRAKSAMPDIHHEFVDVFSSPTAEAARAIVTGTMHGSYGGLSAQGRAFQIDQAVFAHIRDGKCAGGLLRLRSTGSAVRGASACRPIWR